MSSESREPPQVQLQTTPVVFDLSASSDAPSSSMLDSASAFLGFKNMGSEEMERDFKVRKAEKLDRVTVIGAWIDTIFTVVWSAVFLPSHFDFFNYDGSFWRLQVTTIHIFLQVYVPFVFMWVIAALYRFRTDWAARHGELCHVLWGAWTAIAYSLTPDRMLSLLGSDFASERERYFRAAAARNTTFSSASYRCRGYVPTCAGDSVGGGSCATCAPQAGVPTCYFRNYELLAALVIIVIFAYLSGYCRIAAHRLFSLFAFTALVYLSFRIAFDDLDSSRLSFAVDCTMLIATLWMLFLSARRTDRSLRKEFAMVRVSHGPHIPYALPPQLLAPRGGGVTRSCGSNFMPCGSGEALI